MSSANIALHSTPFDKLSDPRRVWNCPPNSVEEGLGRLVLLTPEVVAYAAATCIKTGKRTSLGWNLEKLEVANFNRQPIQHHIIAILNGLAFDDVIILNPQQSSQWDGLRHFSGPHAGETERLFYGGTKAAEITDPKNSRIGMQYWARQGICGRGILLDYVRYAEKNAIHYTTFSDHTISLQVLLQIAKEQNVTFRRGDILLIRIGVTKEWDENMSPEDKQAYAHSSNPQHAGVEGTEEMLHFLWDKGFAAVASDAISFEVYPPKKTYPRADGTEVAGCFLHEFLLAGWGMPIGELFDLEDLSRLCEEHQRWSFFISSAPLNLAGGVSSPPNCIALF
jgi:kynurenine formamidase